MGEIIYSFILWFLKYFLPPMIANASPLLVNGAHCIDFGKSFVDGRPVLGKSKTWEGLIIGVYMGGITALALSIILNDSSLFPVGLGASFSALIGDMAGSFIKRRVGLESGAPFPFLDQLDFALMTIAYYYIIGCNEVLTRMDFIMYSLLLIIILHIISNNIAYYIGVKYTRW